MSVGPTVVSSQIDNILTSLAVELRKVMQEINNLDRIVNGTGAGLTYLQSIGYGSASNPANPGSVSDSQYALDLIDHMEIVAGVYSGTSTQTSLHDYDLEFAPLWGAQIS